MKTSVFGVSSFFVEFIIFRRFLSKRPFANFGQGCPSARQEATEVEPCHPRDDVKDWVWGCSLCTWRAGSGIRLARVGMGTWRDSSELTLQISWACKRTVLEKNTVFTTRSTKTPNNSVCRSYAFHMPFLMNPSFTKPFRNSDKSRLPY